MFTTNASGNVRGREFFEIEKLQAFPTYDVALNCSFLKTYIQSVSPVIYQYRVHVCELMLSQYFIFVTLL